MYFFVSFFYPEKKFDKVVELVGGGSVINGAKILNRPCVSGVVERFSVSHMQVFFVFNWGTTAPRWLATVITTVNNFNTITTVY